MLILVIGLVFALALLFVPRILGRSQAATLEQYEILERRFHLNRRTFSSAWGAGIGERATLEGEFRGYSLSLYDHSNDSDPLKRVWTTLAFEAPFAGEREIRLCPRPAIDESWFPESGRLGEVETELSGWILLASDALEAPQTLNEEVRDRLEAFPREGAFRLSKGFFEYREIGRMENADMRIRFQEALLILADWSDRLEELIRR